MFDLCFSPNMAILSSIIVITIYHLIRQSKSSVLSNLTLITDPLMPVPGAYFGVYVNETSEEIWLFSLDTKIISICYSSNHLTILFLIYKMDIQDGHLGQNLFTDMISGRTHLKTKPQHCGRLCLKPINLSTLIMRSIGIAGVVFAIV